MATMEFELKHGLLTGKGTADETLHKTVKLRELTASDVIDAQLAAERVVLGENGKAVAYCSEVLMGLEMMRRQVAAIGSIPGPLDMKQLRMLHPADLELISTKAAALDDMLEEVATRGELMPLAAALMNLLVSLSQRFSIQYLEQLPLRQLFRLIKQLEKQHGNR